MEYKIEEILHADNHKEKNKNTYNYNIQELSDVVKRPNLRIHMWKKRVEIQSKSIENLFNEILAENFPILCRHPHTGGISNS
jgi:hypothetical protein